MKRLSFSSWLLLGAALFGQGCIASSVLESSERAVELPASERAWHKAAGAELEGLFASQKITGAAAGVLTKIYYWFDPGGSYTGAALFAETPPRFETLSGTWQLQAGKLVLSGSEPATIEAADGALRLGGSDGTVVLVHVDTF